MNPGNNTTHYFYNVANWITTQIFHQSKPCLYFYLQYYFTNCRAELCTQYLLYFNIITLCVLRMQALPASFTMCDIYLYAKTDKQKRPSIFKELPGPHLYHCCLVWYSLSSLWCLSVPEMSPKCKMKCMINRQDELICMPWIFNLAHK